jgi:hypothetical protein
MKRYSFFAVSIVMWIFIFAQTVYSQYPNVVLYTSTLSGSTSNISVNQINQSGGRCGCRSKIHDLMAPNIQRALKTDAAKNLNLRADEIDVVTLGPNGAFVVVLTDEALKQHYPEEFRRLHPSVISAPSAQVVPAPSLPVMPILESVPQSAPAHPPAPAQTPEPAPVSVSVLPPAPILTLELAPELVFIPTSQPAPAPTPKTDPVQVPMPLLQQVTTAATGSGIDAAASTAVETVLSYVRTGQAPDDGLNLFSRSQPSDPIYSQPEPLVLQGCCPTGSLATLLGQPSVTPRVLSSPSGVDLNQKLFGPGGTFSRLSQFPSSAGSGDCKETISADAARRDQATHRNKRRCVTVQQSGAEQVSQEEIARINAAVAAAVASAQVPVGSAPMAEDRTGVDVATGVGKEKLDLKAEAHALGLTGSPIVAATDHMGFDGHNFTTFDGRCISFDDLQRNARAIDQGLSALDEQHAVSVKQAAHAVNELRVHCITQGNYAAADMLDNMVMDIVAAKKVIGGAAGATVRGVEGAVESVIHTVSHPYDTGKAIAKGTMHLMIEGMRAQIFLDNYAEGRICEEERARIQLQAQGFDQLMTRVANMTWEEALENSVRLTFEPIIWNTGLGMVAGAITPAIKTLKAVAKVDPAINKALEASAAVVKSTAEVGVQKTQEALKVIEANPALVEAEGLSGAVVKLNEAVWSMPEQGKFINGRWYTQHALERMAPDTIQVRAILEKRALERGYPRGSKKFLDYVTPRGIPPSVVDDAINNGVKSIGKETGTLEFDSPAVKVIVNQRTDGVITIIPKGG